MGLHYSKEHFDIAQNKRNFRAMDYSRYGRGYVSFTPSEKIIRNSLDMARPKVPGLAAPETVLKVFHYNPDTFVAFAQRWTADGYRVPVGILAHLPLTHEGVIALFDGELDTGEPELRFICKPHQRPAALYFWFIHIPDEMKSGGGMALVMERMTSDKNRNLPIFCKAANDEARAFFDKMGFTQGATYEHMHHQRLMSCVAPMPIGDVKPYDSYSLGQNAGTTRRSVTVVHSLDDILKCIAIRGAAYVEDRSIPYAEDVDGNDFSATHLLGYIGDEPAGCIRLRYFADFVKIERLAVLPRHRGKLAFDLIKAAIAFGQDKGYRHFYGQSAEHVLKLWRHFGFKVRNSPGLVYLTDEVYYEIDLSTHGSSNPITKRSGAAVLVRPEGQWDRPGPLEANCADTGNDSRASSPGHAPPDNPFPNHIVIDGVCYEA